MKFSRNFFLAGLSLIMLVSGCTEEQIETFKNPYDIGYWDSGSPSTWSETKNIPAKIEIDTCNYNEVMYSLSINNLEIKTSKTIIDTKINVILWQTDSISPCFGGIFATYFNPYGSSGDKYNFSFNTFDYENGDWLWQWGGSGEGTLMVTISPDTLPSVDFTIPILNYEEVMEAINNGNGNAIVSIG